MINYRYINIVDDPRSTVNQILISTEKYRVRQGNYRILSVMFINVDLRS